MKKIISLSCTKCGKLLGVFEIKNKVHGYLAFVAYCVQHEPTNQPLLYDFRGKKCS